MLGWALIFFILALVAGYFGFIGLAGLAATIAKVLFLIFLVLWRNHMRDRRLVHDSILAQQRPDVEGVSPPPTPPAFPPAVGGSALRLRP